MTEDLQKLYNRVANNEATTSAVVHVRVQGRSRDIALDLLGINSASPDEAVRNAIANFMELPAETLRLTVIERHENGNMTVRPQAVFG